VTPARAPAPERSRLIAAALATAAAMLVSCGGGQVRPPPPARPPVGDLVSLVPSGASVIAVGRPDALWAAPASRAIVESLVTAAALDDLASRTGVDPRLLTEAVVAEYPAGTTLILVRGPFVAREIVIESEVRMSVVESRTDTPWVRRAGVFGDVHRELIAVDEHVLALATDLEAVTGMLACAARQPSCSPAVSSPDARQLAAAMRGAPVGLIAPDHLELPPGLGTTLLLAEERALAATAEPRADRIALSVTLRGDFPPGADANFRSLVESLSRSELGGVVGLEDALPTLVVTSGDGAVSLAADVPAETVARALRTVFGGEIHEILAPPVRDHATH
jgi:hypothetical protein